MKKYDVIVVGGGPGGFCAAAAAAKAGARTLLVERYGFLGGMATAGLVNPFMGYKLGGKNTTNPVFNDFIGRMAAAGALDAGRHIFDDEYMKYALDAMMDDYNVDVLLHAKFLAPVMDGPRIKAVKLDCKEGQVKASGKVFVDSTGDGDLAAMAGADVEVGRDEDGLCQPMTLCFRVGGIDAGLIDRDYKAFRQELNTIYLKAKAEGRMECPRENVLVFRTLVPSILHFNTTRVVKTSGITSAGLTASEIEARRQAIAFVDLFKKESPAFKNAYLLKLACQIGVRETRRVMTPYAVSEADVVEGRKHADGIAKSTYPIDIHSPTGEGTVIRHVPKDDWYEIPYRCLVPLAVENLVIGARCISSTHAGHSSLRVMPVVASVGEAAGLAAARAAKQGIAPAAVNGTELKKELGL
ncbi:MAG: FAD-dependent oxidoreductase [Planctomycetota bacterium]